MAAAVGLLVGATATTAGATTAGATASRAPAAKGSPLQQGLNFYKNKTITLISPDAVGGGFDVWSRILAPYLASYLHATINIENISPANGIPAMDETAAADPDGLTIGWLNTLNVASHQITNTPGLNFNPERVAFIGSTAPNSSVWIISTSASCPWRSFKQLASGTSAAQPVTELDMPSSTLDLFQRLANVAFGVTARIITGYASSASEVQGFNRGDGCLMAQGATQAGPLIAGGKAVPLGLENAIPAGNGFASDLTGVQTVDQLLKHDPPKTKSGKTAATALSLFAAVDGRILMAPGTIAPAKLEALRWAMQKAMDNPSLRQNALAQGDNPGFVNGPMSKANYIRGLQLGKLIINDLT